MAYFRKQIIYLDYVESEIKTKNVGFVKLQEKGDTVTFLIKLKGIPVNGEFTCEIEDLDTHKKIGSVRLKDGQGQYVEEFDRKAIGESLLKFDQMIGITIPISGKKTIKGQWAEHRGSDIDSIEDTLIQAAEAKKDITQIKKEMEERKIIEEVWVSTSDNDVEIMSEEKKEENNEQDEEQYEEQYQEKYHEQVKEGYGEDYKEEYIEKRDDETPMEVNAEESELQKEELVNETAPIKSEGISWEESKRIAQNTKVCTDKWEQLCTMFSKATPFDRVEIGEYLNIEPKNFVVLTQGYQKMVNNSFLLHGYYNYHHILLGKRIVEGNVKYYLAVPGNFYTREKMVAIMFGFEAFEAAKEEKGKNFDEFNIPEGTYGYYLTSVEI